VCTLRGSVFKAALELGLLDLLEVSLFSYQGRIQKYDLGGVKWWGFVPSPYPLEVGPLNAARDSGDRFKLPSGSGEPQPKLNLVHFSLKI